MGRVVLLDAGPIGLACCHPSLPKTIGCESWLSNLQARGTVILIPAITDYEVRREPLRVGAMAKLIRLASLHSRFGLLNITSEALDQAAQFWAYLRRIGIPTAVDEALDADAILAGMATTCVQPGDSAVIATANLKHLARFPGVDAQPWESIA